MSFEVLEQLEAKVQSAVDTISILQMEIDELKQTNVSLTEQNEKLQGEHQLWQERLRTLLGKMDQMEQTS
ncbi:cell division protein ZapB [Motilimonas eburnea]|uniref:cell division protein ZapB n=1 Tax=Motilimonas eburnea TaxID=1737488 RepID=UPI001E45168C|nr:cell division protein ZapB [Motilimonas eburnea]MCE2572328.1 cell division protein ZapB [Motilimonas eburnea]